MQNYSSSFFHVATLDLSRNKMSFLGANSLKGLFKLVILRENSLSALEALAFGYMPRLVEINFAQNLLGALDFADAFEFTLDSVRHLDFKFNKIRAISVNFFEKFPNLSSLDLSDNSLHSLDTHYFANLHQLERLFLSNNQILTIENSTFDPMTLLAHLDLKNNLIYDLSESLFRKLSRLVVLILGENKLESISRHDFDGLVSLKQLDLGRNRLSSPACDAFGRVNTIETLILCGNLIRECNFEHLKALSFLDLSSNRVEFVDFRNLSRTLSHLDLSSNRLTAKPADLSDFASLKSLNVSISNLEFVLSLNFSESSSIETLDISHNAFTVLSDTMFAHFKKLKHLHAQNTSLSRLGLDLDTLTQLEYVDLSHNAIGSDLVNTKLGKKLTQLKIANVSLLKSLVKLDTVQLSVLDASSNHLESFAYFQSNLTHLDLSHNRFTFMFGHDLDIQNFLVQFLTLRHVNMAYSLTSLVQNRILFFNTLLEYADFSGNSLENFPRFCQLSQTKRAEESQLKTLHFASNLVRVLAKRDLFEMTNLAFLTLANNSMHSIEADSFMNLFNLETLDLSRNSLSFFDDSLFNPLDNLKDLNLSSNLVRVVTSRLFSRLLKLETLDLSQNQLYLLETFAFYELSALRTLHLNENTKRLDMDVESFVGLESVQDIYISAAILTDETKAVFIALFKRMNRYASFRNNRAYFRSLSLSASYEKYACELTLYFIRVNLHFNFKTGQEVNDYFKECSQLSLKSDSKSASFSMDRNEMIFANVFFYAICSFLFLILMLGLKVR